MAKYLIKHWVNADFIVEKVVDESEINNKSASSMEVKAFNSLILLSAIFLFV